MGITPNPKSKKAKATKAKQQKRAAPEDMPVDDEYYDEEGDVDGQAVIDNTINDRHRAWLQSLADEKRVQRENEEQAKADLEQRRLKKKQALVKKAIMRRKQQEKGVGFSATTKLSETKKITKEAKRELTEEERAVAEKQKYDRVVQLRKEHKDRYKKQMAEMKAKLQAEKEAKEAKERKDEDLKRRIKEKALRKLTQDKLAVKTNISSPTRMKSLGSQDDGAGTASAKKLSRER